MLHKDADSKLVIISTVVVFLIALYFLVLSPLVFNKAEDDSAPVVKTAPPLTPQNSDKFVPDLPSG